MKIPLPSVVPAIQWHEGMLLAPHHFQQLDLRYQQALGLHTRLLSPFHWGIMDYSIDPVLLPTGTVRLISCQAVLPDGTTVSYDRERHPQVELDLTAHKPFLASENWKVYLGISETFHQEKRCISWEGEDINDENTQDNVIRIPRLLPRLQLILGQTPPSQFTGFPLLKVACVEDAYVALPFEAPCFCLTVSSPLSKRCGDLVRRIREKALNLTEKWQAQVGSALLHETTHLLRPLVQVLSPLEGAIQTGVMHPYDLYQQLCQTLGILQGLRLDQPSPPIAGYDHDDINASLIPLFEHMEGILTTIEQDYTAMPFDKEGRYFTLTLSPDLLKSDALLIGAKASGVLTEAELEDWMMGAVIASDSCLEAVKTMRSTGAPRRVLKGGELGHLLPGRGSLVFYVTVDRDFIREDEVLHIFNRGDEENRRPHDVIFYTQIGTN